MRAPLSATLLILSACFDGDAAHGMPCANDQQCGLHDRCERADGGTLGVCGGARDDDDDGGSADDSTTDTGVVPMCTPPPDPSRCEAEIPGPMRVATVTEYADPALGNVTAVVAAELTGEGEIDLAVLSFDPYELRVLRNAGNWAWEPVDTFTGLTQPYDLAVTDLECDGMLDFVVTGAVGTVVVPWNGDSFGGERMVAGQIGNFTVAAADVVADAEGYPDLLLANNGAVQLVPNVDGMLDTNLIEAVEDDFSEPWDMVVLGTGTQARVLVVESDDEAFGQTNPAQRVAILQVSSGGTPEIGIADPAVLQTNFQNPWALAVGDFTGAGGVQIAVAERNLTGPMEVSDVYGAVRVFAGPPEFAEVTSGTISVGPAPGVLAAADLDCDGRDDIVVGYGGVAPEDGRGVDIVWGQDPIEPNEAYSVPFATSVGVGTRMAIADFDGDGRPEIAAPDYGIGMDGARIVFVDLEES